VVWGEFHQSRALWTVDYQAVTGPYRLPGKAADVVRIGVAKAWF
jgi:hypothetical protein